MVCTMNTNQSPESSPWPDKLDIESRTGTTRMTSEAQMMGKGNDEGSS